MFAALPVNDLRARADQVARELRHLDVRIQRTNWSAMSVDGAESRRRDRSGSDADRAGCPESGAGGGVELEVSGLGVGDGVEPA